MSNIESTAVTRLIRYCQLSPCYSSPNMSRGVDTEIRNFTLFHYGVTFISKGYLSFSPAILNYSTITATSNRTHFQRKP